MGKGQGEAFVWLVWITEGSEGVESGEQQPLLGLASEFLILMGVAVHFEMQFCGAALGVGFA